MAPRDKSIDERLADASTDTGVFKRRLEDAVWGWLRLHWTKIASALGGLIIGAVVGYVSISIKVSDALHASRDAAAAAAELRKTVEHLVTQRELDLANQRIAELERQMNQAAQHANDAPKTKPKPHR